MSTLFVDCPTGLSGDMILAALLDLGVPKNIIETPLTSLGLKRHFNLKIEESDSNGLRGLKLYVETFEMEATHRSLENITKLLNNSLIDQKLRGKILAVFRQLAEAEASVHGVKINDVHFHEVGALDALIDVVGVCAAIEYLKPKKIFCGLPPAGSGSVVASHGILPVPAPAVLEIAKRNNITLLGGAKHPKGELTTPTGLALMTVLADDFCQPDLLLIKRFGIGLGSRSLDRPNLLRICELEVANSVKANEPIDDLKWEELICQEAWIDDASPEDIANLVEHLRSVGAIEVVAHSVQMKKGRQGISIRAIVRQSKAQTLRKSWFNQATTLGIREYTIGRWVLPRRKGICNTSFGEIEVKQVKHPNGRLSIKPENDELLRINSETGVSIDIIRQEVFANGNEFLPREDWNW